MSFGTENDTVPAKVDLHQVGGGFGAHYWFAHQHQPGFMGGKLKIEATWKLDQHMKAPVQVYVHIPAHHHSTKPVTYRVNTATGWVSVTMNQNGSGSATLDRWVSLGTFYLDNPPEVKLSNENPDPGAVDDEIVFDAVAFGPGAATGPEQPTDKLLNLRNKATLQCLRIPGNDTADGVQAAQGRCQYNFTDNWNMRFQRVNQSSGWYEYMLVNPNTGKCLQVADGQAGPAFQMPCDSTKSEQLWKTSVQRWGDSGLQGFRDVLQNVLSNKVLRVIGTNPQADSPIGQVPMPASEQPEVIWEWCSSEHC